MIANDRRLRTGRSTLEAVAGLIWALTFGAVRDFVWADLRLGLIDLRGLSRATRGLVLIGFALLFAMAAVLVFNDLWRAHFGLFALSAGSPGRGQLLPFALVPATFFLLSMAWSFLLAGALHSHPAVRLATLVFYLLVAIQWTGTSLLGIATGVGSLLELLLAGAAILAVPLFFVLRWRRGPRPVAEFVALFLIVAATFVPAQARMLDLWRLSGIPLALTYLDDVILLLAGFTAPFLYLIGVDIADFVYRAAGWTTEICTTRLPRRALYVLLALAMGWRFRDVLLEALDRLTNRGAAIGYAGALGVPLLAGLVWWLVHRRSRRAPPGSLSGDAVARAASGSAPWLVLGFTAPGLIPQLLVLGTVGLATIGLAGLSHLRTVQEIAYQLGVRQSDWHILVAAVSAAAALWLLRRGHEALALYLGILSTTVIWNVLTLPGRPLARLTWQGSEPVDFWVVVLLALVGLAWTIRRELTPDRAARLLLVVLMSGLVRQTDFIENPLSPVLGFAGIGFIAFGIVWDALTAGSWANESTRGLPRISRIYLYLGYVLFTVTIVNWVLTTHNLSYVESLTGDAAIGGLNLVGKPMLYAIAAVILAAPAASLAQPAGNYVEQDGQNQAEQQHRA